MPPSLFPPLSEAPSKHNWGRPPHTASPDSPAITGTKRQGIDLCVGGRKGAARLTTRETAAASIHTAYQASAHPRACASPRSLLYLFCLVPERRRGVSPTRPLSVCTPLPNNLLTMGTAAALSSPLSTAVVVVLQYARDDRRPATAFHAVACNALIALDVAAERDAAASVVFFSFSLSSSSGFLCSPPDAAERTPHRPFVSRRVAIFESAHGCTSSAAPCPRARD